MGPNEIAKLITEDITINNGLIYKEDLEPEDKFKEVISKISRIYKVYSVPYMGGEIYEIKIKDSDNPEDSIFITQAGHQIVIGEYFPVIIQKPIGRWMKVWEIRWTYNILMVNRNVEELIDHVLSRGEKLKIPYGLSKTFAKKLVKKP